MSEKPKTTDGESHGSEDHGHEHDGHGHDHGHDEHHSHFNLYLKAAGVLTVVTAIEVLCVLPFLGLPFSVKVALILLTAVGKFAGVVAFFMHLWDDRMIFRLLFVSPLAIAVIMIVVLRIMPETHVNPWKMKQEVTAIDKPKELRILPKNDVLLADYTAKQASGFAAGKELFTTNCAACHRADGGGLVGPSFLDDCYKHGGQLEDMYKVLARGVDGTNMIAWLPTLGVDKTKEVVYYVRSLRGQKPTMGEPKACEGEKVVAAAATGDSH
ncbi:MAG: c-type cytochrome [Myxococcota bacterium]